MIYIFAFIVVLIPLIIIHEFGHLIACKSVGISVLEFGLGFPPRVMKLFRWGETDFTLNLLPLGGFVLPYGEDFFKPEGDDAMEERKGKLETEREAESLQLTSVHSAKPWQKIWFLSAGALANFVTAWIIFMLVPMIGLPVQASDVMIDEVLPETEAASKALREGDIVTALNGDPFFNSADLEEQLVAFIEANPDTPVIFSIDRPITGQSFDTELLPNLDVDVPEERVRILEVQPDTPAETAGLQSQDVILAVGEEPIDTLEEMQDLTAANSGTEIILTIERGEDILEVPVTPELLNDEDRARIGIQISILYVAPFGFRVTDENVSWATEDPYSIPDALQYGTEQFIETMELIVNFPAELISGAISVEEARPVSPVGVSQLGAQVIEERPFQDVLIFIAVISIALGVSNLLPIPALDGGRILFVIVEIIRGKPMSPEREGLVHLAGFVLMFMLLIVLVINDLRDPLQFPQ